jgi:hypothetical protein
MRQEIKMAFKQNKDGGYCPKCDTVWASPGVCKCKADYITYSTDELPTPTFHCANCGHSTEGFSICLKCNPQTYRIAGIEKALAPSVFETEIWNKAIEAAADEIEYCNPKEAQEIRKLKR